MPGEYIVHACMHYRLDSTGATKANRQGRIAHELKEDGCKIVVIKLIILCIIAVIAREARVCRTDLLELHLRFCFIVWVFVWVPAEVSEAY